MVSLPAEGSVAAPCRHFQFLYTLFMTSILRKSARHLPGPVVFAKGLGCQHCKNKCACPAGVFADELPADRQLAISPI
jgi:hypothetical protein